MTDPICICGAETREQCPTEYYWWFRCPVCKKRYRMRKGYKPDQFTQDHLYHDPMEADHDTQTS